MGENFKKDSETPSLPISKQRKQRGALQLPPLSYSGRRLGGTPRPTLRPRRSAAIPLVVSMSHVTPAGLGSQVSCPRAHTHLVGGGHARGTPLIAIGEMAGMRREITVRNVVWGNCGSPHPARRDASPHRAAATSAASPAVAGPPWQGDFEPRRGEL